MDFDESFVICCYMFEEYILKIRALLISKIRISTRSRGKPCHWRYKATCTVFLPAVPLALKPRRVVCRQNAAECGRRIELSCDTTCR